MRKGQFLRSRNIVPVRTSNYGTMDKKPRRAINCYDVLESVARIWRLSTVFPMIMKTVYGTKRYSLDKFFAAYSLTFYFLIFGNFVYVMIFFNEYFRHNTTISITAVTALVRATGNQICMFLSIVNRIVQRKEFANAINNLPDLDYVLKRINCPVNHEPSRKIIRAYVLTSISAVVFIMCYDMLTVFRNYHPFSFEYALWNIGLFIQIADITVFVSLIFLLGSNFRALNEKLFNIVGRANASSPKVIGTSDVCADHLHVIARAHFDMCTIGKRINRIFQWEVVISVVTAFIIMSMTLYYIFYEFQKDSELKIMNTMCYVLWEFYHSAPIILLVLVCNWTTQQGIYTGKLIHEIRVEKNSNLYEAVKSFSLQLHHQKLEFSACGFFPIDSTLIRTMIGKITTYLVILIQFQPKID